MHPLGRNTDDMRHRPPPQGCSSAIPLNRISTSHPRRPTLSCYPLWQAVSRSVYVQSYKIFSTKILFFKFFYSDLKGLIMKLTILIFFLLMLATATAYQQISGEFGQNMIKELKAEDEAWAPPASNDTLWDWGGSP
jgi:hypothetical protein